MTEKHPLTASDAGPDRERYHRGRVVRDHPGYPRNRLSGGGDRLGPIRDGGRRRPCPPPPSRLGRPHLDRKRPRLATASPLRLRQHRTRQRPRPTPCRPHPSSPDQRRRPRRPAATARPAPPPLPMSRPFSPPSASPSPATRPPPATSPGRSQLPWRGWVSDLAPRPPRPVPEGLRPFSPRFQPGEKSGRRSPTRVAPSNAWASWSTGTSARCRPTIWIPTGSPSGVNPAGTEIAGCRVVVIQ